MHNSITVTEISRLTGMSLGQIRDTALAQGRYDYSDDAVFVTEEELNLLFELAQVVPTNVLELAPTGS